MADDDFLKEEYFDSEIKRAIGICNQTITYFPLIIPVVVRI